MPDAAPPTPRIILIRGLNWLGDAIMSTPALMRLRAAFPESELILLTPEKLADLWPHHPAINRVMSFSSRDSVWGIARRLRAESFEVALVLPNSPRSALEACWAGIPRRIGYRAPWRNWLLNELVSRRSASQPMRKRSPRTVHRLIRRGDEVPTVFSTAAHHVHHYLHLVRVLGADPTPLAPQVAIMDAEVEAARRRFGLAVEVKRPWLGLNPGAEYGPAKRWPAERFVAAALAVRRQTNCRWIVVGGRGDQALAESITAEIRRQLVVEFAIEPAEASREALNLAGLTSLRELGAVLKECRVVLTNDTGPMHLAAAVGTPVVVPFGSTSPELTGPGLPGEKRHRWLRVPTPCAPCFRRTCPVDLRCLVGIEADTVSNAICQLLKQTAPAAQ
jgi:heptosyltransferase II